MTNKTNCILVINAGSSSLKFKIFQEKDLLDINYGQIVGIGTSKVTMTIKTSDTKKVIKEEVLPSSIARDNILAYLLENLLTLVPHLTIKYAAHRVVHGGRKYNAPTIITQEVIDDLKTIENLSPIHLPHNIRPMELLKQQFPTIKQVACFDTAFHSTNPDYTRYYAIPRKLIEEDQIMRYGFHGLSYEYISGRLKEIDPQVAQGKVVVCHLGAGASLCALVNGKSFTTTMGFTPLDGLVMGSRCGAIDVGILLFLMQNKGYTPKDIEQLVYYQSGVLGLSEESSDFYVIQNSQNPKAQEAWQVFLYNLIKHIGSCIAAMGGIDALVFTAGVGENSAHLRTEITKNFSFLGLILNEVANNNKDELISAINSKIKIYVIPTQEEFIIAKHAALLLN
ncbi:acetate/propionate kinase [Candidatus Hepatincolaceae symbiont of Richtersius coronifer]